MTLNALNGSKIVVASVRITLLKIVKPTPFSVEPFYLGYPTINLPANQTKLLC
jgi:hypothetical protein